MVFKLVRCRTTSRLNRSVRLHWFLQGFGEDVAVARGERDAAESSERRSDIGWSDGLKIFAGLNAKAHQKNGDMLIVIVGHAVAGAVRALLPRWSAIQEPVGLRKDKQIAAAAGKVAKDKGAKRRALRCWAVG